MSLAKKANKRSEAVKFYLSEGEARMLKRQARNHCLSFPAYVRGLIRQEGGLVGRAHDLKGSKTFHKGKGRVIGIRCRKGALGATRTVYTVF